MRFFLTRKNQCSLNLALLQAPLLFFLFLNLGNKIRVLCKNWNIFAVPNCLILQGPAMDSLFSGINIILSLFSHRHFSPCYKYVVLCENSLSSRISCTYICILCDVFSVFVNVLFTAWTETGSSTLSANLRIGSRFAQFSSGIHRWTRSINSGWFVSIIFTSFFM